LPETLDFTGFSLLTGQPGQANLIYSIFFYIIYKVFNDISLNVSYINKLHLPCPACPLYVPNPCYYCVFKWTGFNIFVPVLDMSS